MQRHSIDVKKWRKLNPEKLRAHIAVNNAVRQGKIKKGSCAVCGCEKVEAHHEDYSKPLKVTWLCRKHHVNVHYPNKPTKQPRIIVVDGIKRRKDSTYTALKNKCMCLKSEGKSYKQIGDELNISKSQAYKIINIPKYH